MPAASESWTASSVWLEGVDDQPLKLKLADRALELELLVAMDRLTLLLELKPTLLLELELLLKLLLLLRLLLKESDTARDPCERHGLCQSPAPVTWLSSSALSWRISASPLTYRDHLPRLTTPGPSIRVPRSGITSAAALLRCSDPRPMS